MFTRQHYTRILDIIFASNLLSETEKSKVIGTFFRNFKFKEKNFDVAKWNKYVVKKIGELYEKDNSN